MLRDPSRSGTLKAGFLGRTRSRSGLELAQIRSHPGQIWSNSGHVRPRTRPSLVLSGPNSAESRPNLTIRLPKPDQIWLNKLAECWPKSVELAQVRSTPGQIRWNLSRLWPDSAQFLPDVVELGPCLCQFGRTLIGSSKLKMMFHPGARPTLQHRSQISAQILRVPSWRPITWEQSVGQLQWARDRPSGGARQRPELERRSPGSSPRNGRSGGNLTRGLPTGLQHRC